MPPVLPDASLTLEPPADMPGLTETGLSAADLLRELPAQVLLLGQDRRIRWANDAFCRLSNVTPAQIVGRPVAEFLSNLEAHSTFFSRAFAGEAVEFPLNLHLTLAGCAYDAKAVMRSLPDLSRSGYA